MGNGKHLGHEEQGLQLPPGAVWCPSGMSPTKICRGGVLPARAGQPACTQQSETQASVEMMEKEGELAGGSAEPQS